MIEDAFEKFSFQLDEKLTTWRNEFYNKIDPILTEIENDRENRSISTDEMHKIKDKLDNHEKELLP